MNESFHYLQEKYGVKLVHNDKYNEYNNLYTMYLVKEFLPNAFVLEGDVYLNRNILDETVTQSTYFSAKKSNFNNEWILKIGTDGYLDNIVVGSDHEELIMCGVSYWNQEDGEFLKAKLEQALVKLSTAPRLLNKGDFLLLPCSGDGSLYGRGNCMWLAMVADPELSTAPE